MITPVILCGGSGTRLWPLSRGDNPKQFLRLHKQLSLFQETVKRVQNDKVFDQPIIVGQQQHKFKIAGELEEIGVKPRAIILEPCSKNTAPAIAIAAFFAQQHSLNQPLLILPSDHIIDDTNAFVSCVDSLQNFTKEKLITFGITPTNAATGYGYIKSSNDFGNGINEIQEFVEKPDAKRAKEFLDSGKYLWNAGIFLIDADLYLQELKLLEPGIYECVQKSLKLTNNSCFIDLNKTEFSKAKNMPVDIAIFEKTKKAAVCPIQMQWADLGSWNSFYEYMQSSSDTNNNVTLGLNVHISNCKDNLFYSHNSQHLVANNIQDLAVICTSDTVFVTHRHASEETKKIYAHLKENNIKITDTTTKCYRPWGYFEVILKEINYSVKRICIFPMQEISLQYHNKRNEHWVITKGTATIRKNDDTFLLKENQSVYINAGEIHKVSNATNENLELIEVQTGELIDEDDIVRLEDKYGRLQALNQA